MEQVRAFVAIELSEDIVVRLAEVLDRLRRQMSGVRWVDPGGIHLTLKFLGNVEAERITLIEEALARAVRGAEPFLINFQGLGCFPDTQSPSVIWTGVEGELEPLLRLYSRVEEELERIGFEREARDFSPHLTLGRVAKTVRGAERRVIGEVVAARPIDRLGQMQVEAISLMHSQLTPSGARYSRLALFPLGESQ